jgi:hypothetical protein
MASNWIRVDANVGEDVRISRARRALGCSRPEMIGMVVLLEIRLLEHHRTGELATVDTETLAEWAGCAATKAKKFAAALAELTVDGRIYGWEERHEVLLHRLERDAHRKRLARERAREQRRLELASEGRPADGGGTPSGRPRPTETDDGTERNGDGDGDLLHLESSNRRNGKAPPAAAPPADADDSQLPQSARALLERCSPAKRADVERQLLDSLQAGAKLDRRTRVRAGSTARLEAKCREVLDEGVRDWDKAIVVLLRKLADTSDGSAPGVQLAASAQHDERIAARELATASTWIGERPELVKSIDSELSAAGLKPDAGYELSAAYRMARNSKVVAAWRERGGP